VSHCCLRIRQGIFHGTLPAHTRLLSHDYRYNTGTLLMVLQRPVTPEMRAAEEAKAVPKVKKEAAAAKGAVTKE
jgi:hypothetical protein